MVEARPLTGHRLWLRFADGLAGEINLRAELWGDMFEPLLDPAVFQAGQVDEDLGTVVWPNGADFAPEFLYDEVRRQDRVRSDSVTP